MITRRRLVPLLIISLFLISIASINSCEYNPLRSSRSESLQRNPDRSLLLLDNAARPTPALQSLLHLFDIESSSDLAGIVDATQKKWLRAPGKERWEVDELFPEKKDAAIQILANLGVMEDTKPIKKQFEYALILGATAQRVRTRLNYLIDLWKEGVRFNHLVFLGGARPLDATIESEQVLLNTDNGILPSKSNWKHHGALPATETEMMQMIYDQAELPEGLNALPVTFSHTPMMETANGTQRRPNTGDTIKTWLAEREKDGDALFVSNNPYVGYQDSVVRTYLPENTYTETVGPRAEQNEKLSLYLDTLARHLYQEKLRRTN